MGDDRTEAETPMPTLRTSPINVPTHYADTCLFATQLGSTVRLQFAEVIPIAKDAPSGDGGINLRHVGNLVMPIEGFHNMLEYLQSVVGTYITPREAKDGE